MVEIGVETDQRVEAGAVLFRIDPDMYELAVRRAEAQLEAVGQSIGASTAAVATAKAKRVEAIVKRENAREQAARTFELVKKGRLSNRPPSAGAVLPGFGRGCRGSGRGRSREGSPSSRPNGCNQSSNPRSHGGIGTSEPRPPQHDRVGSLRGRRDKSLAGARTSLGKGGSRDDLHHRLHSKARTERISLELAMKIFIAGATAPSNSRAKAQLGFAPRPSKGA